MERDCLYFPGDLLPSIAIESVTRSPQVRYRFELLAFAFGREIVDGVIPDSRLEPVIRASYASRALGATDLQAEKVRFKVENPRRVFINEVLFVCGLPHHAN